MGLVRLNEKLPEEKVHYTVLAAAVTVAPARGNIWEPLVTPGQQVHPGQELLRVLDCDRAVVTAVVSEAVYNRLQVGSSARFLPRGAREELVGRVTRLTSASASPSSLAVRPSALTGETYRVTVSVPKIAEGENCIIGRTGRLNFDNVPLEIETAANASTLP